MRDENLASDRHVLVLRTGVDETQLPDEASDGFRIDLMCGGETDETWLPAVDSPASLALGQSLRDGAVDPQALPAFVRAALENRRMGKIYAPSDFAIGQGGLRFLPPEWLALIELY
jgi:hypothetical protein